MSLVLWRVILAMRMSGRRVKKIIGGRTLDKGTRPPKVEPAVAPGQGRAMRCTLSDFPWTRCRWLCPAR